MVWFHVSVVVVSLVVLNGSVIYLCGIEKYLDLFFGFVLSLHRVSQRNFYLGI